MNKVARVREKGDITIPKALRQKWGIAPGDLLGFEETERGLLLTRREVIAKWVSVLPICETTLAVSSAQIGHRVRSRSIGDVRPIEVHAWTERAPPGRRPRRRGREDRPWRPVRRF